MTEFNCSELSYNLIGLAINTHKTVGRFGWERDYAVCLENEIKLASIPLLKRGKVAGTGYRINFIVDNKIAIIVRAKKYLLMDDYYQIKKCLHALNLDLALLLNFKTDFLKPIRIFKGERAPGAGLPIIDIVE